MCVEVIVCYIIVVFFETQCSYPAGAQVYYTHSKVRLCISEILADIASILGLIHKDAIRGGRLDWCHALSCTISRTAYIVYIWHDAAQNATPQHVAEIKDARTVFDFCVERRKQTQSRMPLITLPMDAPIGYQCRRGLIIISYERAMATSLKISGKEGQIDHLQFIAYLMVQRLWKWVQ